MIHSNWSAYDYLYLQIQVLIKLQHEDYLTLYKTDENIHLSPVNDAHT